MPTSSLNTTSLLTISEKSACRKLANANSGLESQRAAALLAVAAGKTQAEAAEESGLTHGQVRYLVATFRRKRMTMFGGSTPARQTTTRTRKPTAANAARKTVSAEKSEVEEKTKKEKSGKKKAESKKKKDKKDKKKDTGKAKKKKDKKKNKKKVKKSDKKRKSGKGKKKKKK